MSKNLANDEKLKILQFLKKELAYLDANPILLETVEVAMKKWADKPTYYRDGSLKEAPCIECGKLHRGPPGEEAEFGEVCSKCISKHLHSTLDRIDAERARMRSIARPACPQCQGTGYLSGGLAGECSQCLWAEIEKLRSINRE